MKTFLVIFCLMAVVEIISIEAAPQRVRGGSTSSSSSTTETTVTARSSRLRTHRRSTTETPDTSNDDLIRKGLINKLCTRKYQGKGPTTTTTTTGSPPDSESLSTSASTTTSTTTTTEAPSAPTKRSRSRSRSARAASRVSTAAPAFGPSCSDFDDLSFEQLINRNKAALRPVRRRESSLKSDA